MSTAFALPTVPSNTPMASQPVDMKLPLYDYQRRSLYLMLAMEATPEVTGLGSGVAGQHQKTLTSKGGIIADVVGMGKTALIIAVMLSTRHADIDAHQAALASPHPNNNNDLPSSTPSLTPSLTEGEVKTMSPTIAIVNGSLPMSTHFGRASAYSGIHWSSDHKYAYSLATMVVTPQHLCSQWHDEVIKFTGSGTLKVIAIATNKDHSAYSYTDIIRADVIITTLEYLSGDAYRGRVQPSRKQTGRPPPSDDDIMSCRDRHLHSIHWRRLVFDECHTAIKLGGDERLMDLFTDLRSQNTWLVSGTPFPHGDRSMYGMHQLLGLRLRVHVSNNPFARSNAPVEKDSVFERLKRRLYLRNSPESVGNEWLRIMAHSIAPDLDSSNPSHHNNDTLNDDDNASGDSKRNSTNDNDGDSKSESNDSKSLSLPTSRKPYDENVIHLAFSRVERAFYDAQKSRGEYKNPYADECLQLRQLCVHPAVDNGWAALLAKENVGNHSSKVHSLEDLRQRTIVWKEVEMKKIRARVRKQRHIMHAANNALMMADPMRYSYHCHHSIILCFNQLPLLVFLQTIVVKGEDQWTRNPKRSELSAVPVVLLNELNDAPFVIKYVKPLLNVKLKMIRLNQHH
jgi:hypothetical protein